MGWLWGGLSLMGLGWRGGRDMAKSKSVAEDRGARIVKVLKTLPHRGAVSIALLRDLFAVPKWEFDQGVILARDAGWLVLHKHDLPAGLSGPELADMLKVGSSYYVAVGLRE